MCMCRYLHWLVLAGLLFLLITAIFGNDAANLKIEKGANMNKYCQLKLNEAEIGVIKYKGTERAFTGKFDKHYKEGVYTCRQCGVDLFYSDSKFNSKSGWPSFDEFVPGSVKEVADGSRTEIVCANCGAHLGHVFKGEGFTPKNTRHCVNSISLDFEEKDSALPLKHERALFAGGCFWGVEHYFNNEPGVLKVTSGYSGGKVVNPSYKAVSSGLTGHAETVEVIFDPAVTNYEKLARLFLEIHDPTQLNRQGPDIGTQYRSEIFYTTANQRSIAEKLVAELKGEGYEVVTRINAASKFYPAEDYHQKYYERTGKEPYCHIRVKRFK